MSTTGPLFTPTGRARLSAQEVAAEAAFRALRAQGFDPRPIVPPEYPLPLGAIFKTGRQHGPDHGAPLVLVSDGERSLWLACPPEWRSADGAAVRFAVGECGSCNGTGRLEFGPCRCRAGRAVVHPDSSVGRCALLNAWPELTAGAQSEYCVRGDGQWRSLCHVGSDGTMHATTAWRGEPVPPWMSAASAEDLNTRRVASLVWRVLAEGRPYERSAAGRIRFP